MNALQVSLVEAIRGFVLSSPLNQLSRIDGSPIFSQPLVGFADGDDPLFEQYKTVVSAEHLSPRQALSLSGIVSPQASVVAWVLPIARPTRAENRQMDTGPALRWNHTRFDGEDFNNALRRFVVDWLDRQGIAAAAPVLGPGFRQLATPGGPCSTWSERHMAYAAGLGTFSLSDGLITQKGIAHRCGSVVAATRFEATPRPYTHYQEYCPFQMNGSCGACIQRCPAGAISPAGHDKLKCEEYTQHTLLPWLEKPGYRGAYPACGLCQAGVPCESRIPLMRAPR